MNDAQKPAAEIHDQTLHLFGEWRVTQFQAVRAELEALDSDSLAAIQQLETHELDSIDSSAAHELMQFIAPERILSMEAENQPEHHMKLLHAVARALQGNEPPAPRPYRFGDGIAALGKTITQKATHQIEQTNQLLNFIGLVLLRALKIIVLPHRWRVTSFFVHVHQSGLNAIPIVALLTFLVGAVVAFLGATVLSDFGATIYTVDLVAYAFMRELGVLLTAILLAGRTASSYTAQIGAMKVNQEIDALRVQGLDPIELLVIPRLLALLFMLPLLTLVAMVSGIIGGLVVAVFSLDISVTQFFRIVQEVPIRHLWVGLVKAPLFAAVIAIIGCLEGFKVKGNARSVGQHTTSAVVQAIFIVILFDAIAALFFMEMGW